MSNFIAKAPKTLHSLAGANSKNGFVGIFDQIFTVDAFDRIYIITGAPGTGKSKLMRDVASQITIAEEKEFIYCSSDPSSLDGVILKKGNRRVGILDGTAPHGRLPTFPGSAETVIDLGRFWRKEALARSKEKIRELSCGKKTSYEDAYAALAIAGAAKAEQLRLLERSFLRKKAEAVTMRIFKRISPTVGNASVRYQSAIGMTGEISLADKSMGCQTVYRLPSFYGAELLCLSILCEQLNARHAAYVRIPAVIDPFLTEAVILPKNSVAFFASAFAAKSSKELILNPRRFIDGEKFRSLRQRIRALAAIEEKEIQAAKKALAEAGERHFALEKIFCKAMDFQAKEAYTAQLIEDVQKELDGDGGSAVETL